MKLAWLWEVVVLVENHLIFIAKHCVTIFCCALLGFSGKFSILLWNCKISRLWKGCGYSCWWSEWNSRLELIWVSLAWSNWVITTPPPSWMRCLSIASLPPSISPGFLYNLPVPIYTSGWRETLRVKLVLSKNSSHWPWPIDLEPRPLDPESSTLNFRPLGLSLENIGNEGLFFVSQCGYFWCASCCLTAFGLSPSGRRWRSLVWPDKW